MDAQSWAGSAAEAAQGRFTLTPAQPGTVYLQGRGRAYGYPLEWGRVHAVSVNAAGSDPFDCVLNWAEAVYPGMLAPAKPAPATLGPYYYRAYPATNSYVGLSAADDHVYFLDGGVMQDLGAQDHWLTAAGCAKAS